jgi:Predicted transcription factor, homolog of eukaryotic MBF1
MSDMITKFDLLDRLFFEENLLDAEILEQKEIEQGVSFVMARLEFDDAIERYMTLPFVVYDNEDWIFTPWDWQDDFSNITADAIPDIRWRINNSEKEGIIFDGVPRLFGFEPAIVRTETRKRIGKLIKTTRENQGLTTRELAKKCGIAYNYICRIEGGRYNTSIDTLSVICKALNIYIDIIPK